MRRKYKYAFARKKETEGGMISLIYAGLSLVLFLVAAMVSFRMDGNAGRWVGALGVMAIAFSGVGFWTGMQSFKEKDKSYRFSALGSIVNGIFLVGWLALFLNGIM